MFSVEKYFQLNEAFVLRVSFDIGIEKAHESVLLFKGRFKGIEKINTEKDVLATFPATVEGENFAIKIAKNLNLFMGP